MSEKQTVQVETEQVSPVDAFGNTTRESAQDLKVDKVPVYGWDVDDDNNVYPVLVGEEDRTAFIQSFADGCDFKALIKRAEETGDVSFLSIKKGFYGDTVGMPDNINDLAQANTDAGITIDQLSSQLGITEDLASLSSEQLNKVIADAVNALATKKAVENQTAEKE